MPLSQDPPFGRTLSDRLTATERSRTQKIFRAAALIAAIGVATAACDRSRDDSAGTRDGKGAGEATRTVGFEDRAEAAGITFRTSFLPDEQGANFKVNFYDHGSGVAVGDFDGDGRDDLYFCNQLGPNALYRNAGGGRFEDVTAKAGPVALADRVSVSAVFADYDNDGREDLFVTTTMGGNALFHNEGGGRFEDVTEKAGVALVAHSQSATFFDADGDGLLDLLVSNTAKWTLDFDAQQNYFRGGPNIFSLVASPKEDNNFFRNRGDGTFVDRTGEAGLSGTGWSGDTAVFDVDEDGDQDVLVVNMFGASHLYENDGRGRFLEITKRVFPRISWGAVASKTLDYDDDGRLDLVLTDMHSDMWMGPAYVPNPKDGRTKYDGPDGPLTDAELSSTTIELRARLGIHKEDVFFGNSLFHAKGGSRFEEVSDAAGVETLWPWGVAAGDFDGDGYEDLSFASGMGYPYQFFPSPVLMNDGRGHFVNKAKELGLDPMPGGTYAREPIGGKAAARSSRAVASADFDDDGRLDLVVNDFNDKPLLLMNRWPARSWVAFRLRGTKGSRDAVGAVVRIRLGEKTLTRQVQAAGGYLAQSSLMLHFGLGDAKAVDACEITWPGGARQSLRPGVDFSLGRVNAVEQPR
jgi:hypothetical protein